jgi:hypothetical protein
MATSDRFRQLQREIATALAEALAPAPLSQAASAFGRQGHRRAHAVQRCTGKAKESAKHTLAALLSVERYSLKADVAPICRRQPMLLAAFFYFKQRFPTPTPPLPVGLSARNGLGASLASECIVDSPPPRTAGLNVSVRSTATSLRWLLPNLSIAGSEEEEHASRADDVGHRQGIKSSSSKQRHKLR